MPFLISLMVWLIGLFITLALLHWVITSAINSSELARNIREIKELLKAGTAIPDEAGRDPSAEDGEADGTGGDFEECPGCGARVRSTDEVCPSCGLTLLMREDG